MIEMNIGTRVKAFREANKMNQVELATVLGVNDRQTVSEIENGRRRLTAAELVRVGEHFNVSLESLTNPFLLSARDSFSWRQNHVPAADLDVFEARAGEWIGAYRELNRLSDKPLKKLLPRLGLTYQSRFEDAAEDGESVAVELGLTERPAKHLASMLEDKLGILILMVDAIDGVSGAACRLSELNAILINRNESAARRNSDLAHELFHILTWIQMKPERVESSVEAWDQPPSRSQKRNLRIEQLADSFAAALCMPSWELERIGEPNKRDAVAWLAAGAVELGVSARALKWRLVNTKRWPQAANIPNEDLDDYTRSIGGQCPIPLPFSRNFIATIAKGIESGHLSGGRAAQLLGMSKDDLGNLCEAYVIGRPIEL